MTLTPSFSVLFTAFPHGLREPDPFFWKECEALKSLGVPIHVVNTDALMDGDLDRALQYLGEPSSGQTIYRGWVLRPAEYATMYKALSHRGFDLLTSPESYASALLFPKFFPVIEHAAIPATWVEGHDLSAVLRAAKRMGDPPYFIKDYIKSAKAIAPLGCVVEGRDLRHEMQEAIEALVDYRGDRFEGGIVVRPLIKLRYIDECPFGGAIFEEYRLYFFQGKMISQSTYERVGGDPRTIPDYSYLGRLIPSPFFTVDIVVTEEGNPMILEVGDGGVSGLPPSADPCAFYQRIVEALA